MYQSGVNRLVVYEGGIELNPLHRKEINTLKKINFKFIFILTILNILLYLLYASIQANGGHDKYLLELLLGFTLLAETFIHIRHFRTIDNFKTILNSKDISGQIKYGRAFMHRQAGGDALIFAIFFLLLFILVGRYFFLGGAIACLVLSRIQKKWLKKIQKELKS